MNNQKIRIGQLWQAKQYSDYNANTVIIHEVNKDVVWVELKDGCKHPTSRQQLTDNYRLLTHHDFLH